MSRVGNPSMLTLAREIRSITQTKLSKISGIDQGKISRYEGGISALADEDLKVLADSLSFPIEFFFQDGMRLGAEATEIFHRKRRTVSATHRKRIDGLMNLHRIGSDRLLEAFEQISDLTIPTFETDDFDNISDIANAVRATWKMPAGPVDNLINRLEAASSLVFSYDFESPKIDEAVQWIEPSPPIILVNSTAPADRLRFSLAHALGHLVMHHNKIPYESMEKEADQFASAFLMPAEDIISELKPVTIQHMLELKQYWKVSMQALIYRAKDLNVISDRRYKSLFQQLSRAGYRKTEPFPIPHEKPKLVKALIESYKVDLKYSDEELAKLLRVTLEDFYKWYYPYVDKPRPKVLQFPINNR